MPCVSVHVLVATATSSRQSSLSRWYQWTQSEVRHKPISSTFADECIEKVDWRALQYHLAPTGNGTELLFALATVACNNLQKDSCWYAWSPRPVHAPYTGPSTLHLCWAQVALNPVKLSFHCRCSIKVLAGALLDFNLGCVKCLTGRKEPASD